MEVQLLVIIKMEVWSFCVVLFSLVLSAKSIMWHLEPNAQKCLKEELQQNVPVTGEFEVSEAPGQKINYVVSIDLRLQC